MQAGGDAFGSDDGTLANTIPGWPGLEGGAPLCESFNDGPSTLVSNTATSAPDQILYVGKYDNSNPAPTRAMLRNQGISTGFPTIGETGDATLWMQDTRDFYANHEGNANILYADGSVRQIHDANGDGYINPGFAVDADFATTEATGYLDGKCEVNPWDLFPGTFLNQDLPIKKFD